MFLTDVKILGSLSVRDGVLAPAHSRVRNPRPLEFFSMDTQKKKFTAQIPELNLSEGSEMLSDFSREAQRHLMSARNSLLILETVPTDLEAIENVFKTFHTIKGLADFLNLKDISDLTHEAEQMLNMSRKQIISLDSHMIQLSKESINGLQKLLELLDEQITNDGKLKSPYHDVTDLMSQLQDITSQTHSQIASAKKTSYVLPTIDFHSDDSLCNQLEKNLREEQTENLTLKKEFLQKLLADFHKASRELKETQSKLQERQRELFKERELAMKLTQQAQTEAKAKSQYLANISHEIRTLINAILGFTDLLRDGALTEKQKDHVNTIILSGKMLLGIVNDILDFSKVEAGKLTLESIEFDLEHIVEEVFKIIRTRLLSKPINLYFHIDENIPRNLVGDPTRLKQIFINLLDNAIKFTESGEIGIEITLDQTHQRGDGSPTLRFMVQDTGIGIPDDRQKHIFESFTQADSSTTRLYGGSGLGLTLCKSFVEKMGGKIWVESVVGKGSQFIFVVKFPPGKTAAKSDDRSIWQKFAGTPVMIVEGHAASSRTLLSLCEKMQFNVLSASQTAKQAAESLLKHEVEKKPLPRIIFIDVMLPHKEGYMLSYKIRQQERYNSIKMIAMSSDIKADTSQDFRQMDFRYFFVKPIMKSEFLELIKKLLDEKAADRRVVDQQALQKISCEGIRVLVVEDSAPNQELLKIHLESLGCNCDFVSNGQEAVDAVKKNDYDICFMDLQMPVMGGIEATQKIRAEINSKIPIVALTAAEMEEEKARCYSVGMNDYLAKPFDLEQLKGKIIKVTKM